MAAEPTPSPEALEAARIAIRRGAAPGQPIPPCRCFAISAPRQVLRCNGVCEEAAEHVALAFDRFAEARVEAERPTKFLAWAVEMFGPIALEQRERALRFIEEAVELAHAMNIDAATMQSIISRVYARPAGEPVKEAAQSLACLECLALVLDIDLNKEADAEFARVQTIPRAEWTRRHAAKVALGFAETQP